MERLTAGCDEVLARSVIRQIGRMTEPGKEKQPATGTSLKMTLKHGGDSTMLTSRKFFNALLAAAALVIMSASAFGADPGLPFPAESQVSDQKAGSVLVYNVYTSSTANPGAQNTWMFITNTSTSSAAFAHLFFVANNCSVADRFICLTALQTAAIDAFSEDPGITGYLIVVANDGVTGCPASFNFLIGSEYVKFSEGYFGALGAEAFAALFTPTSTVPLCDDFSTEATLRFNGLPNGYNRVPRVLAASSLGSRADQTFHRIFVNSMSGNLFSSVSSFGNLFGIVYDEAEATYSWTLPGNCQLTGVLGDANFPRTTPRFDVIIPANSTGWMKFWAINDNGIIGAIFTRNPTAGQNQNAFNGARNLHKLTFTSSTLTMPIFPPSC